MINKMKNRRVVEVLFNRENKEYSLKLECGHTVSRRDTGKRAPPQSTYCDECKIVIDRLNLAEDWVTAREIKSSIPTLKFLEQEGYVEEAKAHHSQTIYWKKPKGYG